MRYDGLEPEELAIRLDAPRCLCFDRVASTLDVVHEIAEQGAPAGTVVLADEQAEGRGRHGRRWQSQRGSGILLAYLARPRVAAESGLVALRAGLAVVQSLGELGVEAGLKWPNDVVVRDRKLGGILCEARWAQGRPRWVAVGIGLNVHGRVPPEVSTSAVALDDVRAGTARLDVLQRLVPRLHAMPDAAQLDAVEQDAFRHCDWLRGRWLSSPVEGRASGVGPDGALLVETEDGLERIVGSASGSWLRSSCGGCISRSASGPTVLGAPASPPERWWRLPSCSVC
jgi:BirA family biotin operon repressor/biotin-[acetyl-CoA-carboxylase] ligase